MRVRVSYGSAIGLGLLDRRADVIPKTVYLMVKGDCIGGCRFCAQAGGEDERLSRVTWPEFELEEVAGRITNQERVCIQCLNYDGVFEDLLKILGTLPDIPISVSAPPFAREKLEELEKRVERIGISIDAATEEIFGRIKPGYSWEKVWTALQDAIDVFGADRVSTHLIAGLGETEEEMIAVLGKVVKMGATPSLFAFTPLKGTGLEGAARPPLDYYRRLQVARARIVHGIGEDEAKNNPDTYTVNGCPGCDRPYYNEGPAGPFYNYPRKPNKGEMTRIVQELK